MNWQWWDQPYVRLPKFLGISFSVIEPSMETVSVKEILFRREQWVASPSWDQKTGKVGKLFHVVGVPGTRQHGLSYFFPAWRCMSCKAIFIGSELSDLHHGCTEPDLAG